MSMMEYLKEKGSSIMDYISLHRKPATWAFIAGAAVVGYFWFQNYTPSDRVASAPNRIIAPAKNMAKGALNPDKLEVRVCDALPKQEGNETLLVIGGKNYLATQRNDGGIDITLYTGDEWDCKRF